MHQEQSEKNVYTEVALTDTIRYEDGLIHKLRETVDKLRSEVKDKHAEIEEKSEKIEQLQTDVELFEHKISESKKRSKKYQSQVKILYQERVDFLAQLQDQKLGILEKENVDFEQEESTMPRFTILELKEVLNERNDLKNRVNDLEEELMAHRILKPVPDVKKSECVRPNKDEEDPPVQGMCESSLFDVMPPAVIKHRS